MVGGEWIAFFGRANHQAVTVVAALIRGKFKIRQAIKTDLTGFSIEAEKPRIGRVEQAPDDSTIDLACHLQ